MDNIFSIITMSKLWGIVMCAMLSALTPSFPFMIAVVVACIFNTVCGMRADGVTVLRCKAFSWKKFKAAIGEMVLFVLLLGLIAIVCHLMGDEEVKFYTCKTVAWGIAYCNFINGMKNLCKTYPENKALWLIYLFFAFDFARLVKIDTLIERYKEHTQKIENGNQRPTTEGHNA